MRDEMYDLMTVYEPEFQYRWNDVIHEGFDAFAKEVATLLPEGDLTQDTKGRRVYWRDGEGKTQAMFAFIVEPTDLDAVIETYQEIKREKIPLTFVIIEQRDDGPRNYDIFRISERSYMEHNNRAWPQGRSPDSL